jgi:uncharacterized protein (TIGR02646 family)
MRKVIKDFDDKPLSLTRQTTLDNLKIILQTKDSNKIDSDIYRGKYDKLDGTKGNEVIEKLVEYYFKKCAYCEDYATIYIEHYRPKGRVIKTKHGGYFWLCYEWSNLVPTCHECNKIGGGKGDQFPIKNNQIEFKDCLKNQDLDPNKVHATYLNQLEEPFLLHPEIDEPKAFLSVEIADKNEGIALKGLDGKNGRGEQTIKICNLNRESLLISRQDIITEFIKNIDLALNYCKINQLIREATLTIIHLVFTKAMSESKDLSKDFTLLRGLMINNENIFEKIVIPQLEISQQSLVREAFKAYKNGTL